MTLGPGTYPAHRARSLSWADELPVFRRDLRGFVPALDAELAKDRGDVMAHGLLGDEEPCSDLRVCEPFGDESEHLRLSTCESSRMLSRARPGPAGDSRAALAELPRGERRCRPGAERGEDLVASAQVVFVVALHQRPGSEVRTLELLPGSRRFRPLARELQRVGARKGAGLLGRVAEEPSPNGERACD